MTDHVNIEEIFNTFNLPFKLKDLQLECLKTVLKGKDLFAVLPTGYGKTILYSILPKLLCTGETKLKIDGASSESDRNSVVVVISPLVSLMKDQIINIKSLGIDCVYLGENLEKGVLDDIKNGKVPILLMSPESLFTGSWRRLFETEIFRSLVSAIVVDEAHCVDQWGDEFRKDYSRISELRSLLPQAVMVALTATATKDMRIKIAKLLGMNCYDTVIGCCDRKNIMYFAKQASYDIEENFQWLIDELITKKEGTPKVIVYCRNIKSCSQLYALFRKKLGAVNSYIGQPSAKNCMYAMFHHSTPEKNKNIITENFRKDDSNLRVVFATNAFGMGVNVKDVHKVIHWGASKSFPGFMQESGRAGRDNNSAFSAIYYHPVDISATATDEHMRQYCKLTSCRRQYLLNHFSPENMNTPYEIVKHHCCDNCAKVCRCECCPADFNAFISDEEDSIVAAAAEQFDNLDIRPYRTIHKEDRDILRKSIEEMRRTMVENENYSPTIIPVHILTGLSDKVIENIVNNAHYFFDAADIYGEYVSDESVAINIIKIIEDVCQ